jgi:hypothetical protein
MPGFLALPNRCAALSSAAGKTSSRAGTWRFTRIAAGVTDRKARIGCMPMMRPTATTLSTGSQARSGATRRSVCPARRPEPPRPSPPPRPAIPACAPSLPKPAAPASMTMSYTRARASKWSDCGYGWRKTSPAFPYRIARPCLNALASAPPNLTVLPPRRQSVTAASTPLVWKIRRLSIRRIGCACR